MRALCEVSYRSVPTSYLYVGGNLRRPSSKPRSTCQSVPALNYSHAVDMPSRPFLCTDSSSTMSLVPFASHTHTHTRIQIHSHARTQSHPSAQPPTRPPACTGRCPSLDISCYLPRSHGLIQLVSLRERPQLAWLFCPLAGFLKVDPVRYCYRIKTVCYSPKL